MAAFNFTSAEPFMASLTSAVFLLTTNASLTEADASATSSEKILGSSDTATANSHQSLEPSDTNRGNNFHSRVHNLTVTPPRDYGYGSLVCHEWLPVNHIYFQLVNLFLFLSYLAPNGIYGILYLRATLSIGCFFFSLWGWVILCAFDTFLWNAIFVVINVVHVIIICYCLRPVRFTPELEQVYRNLFQPLKVSRHQYKKVLDCMKLIRPVKFQEIYAQEKITRVDSLSLVLSGRLVISQNGRALHIVSQHQFLDSPEWFGVSTDEFFQVSATAIEDSRVLIWHRDKLKLTIMGDQFLQAVFDHILGRDVVKKLMQIAEFRRVNESLSGMANGHCSAGGAGGNGNGASANSVAASSNEDSETKPLLVVKKVEESGSITAILSRQLQVDDTAPWRLGRIEETDQETSV